MRMGLPHASNPGGRAPRIIIARAELNGQLGLMILIMEV